MSEIKDGGQAFPVPGVDAMHARGYGMTLRDYFAAKALEGWIASLAGNPGDPFIPGHMGRTADRCYAMADAMIAAREQS